MEKPRLDRARIKALAELQKSLSLPRPRNFHRFTDKDGGEIVAADRYPPLGHPRAPDFFFAAVLQQHRFLYALNGKWSGSLYGLIEGKQTKGSDLLWKVMKRAFDDDPERFTPQRLAEVTMCEFWDIMRDDSGAKRLALIPFPDAPERIALWKQYGAWMVEHKKTPSALVRRHAKTKRPATNLLRAIREIPGFAEDPFGKKANLLLVALMNRPERWVVPEEGFELPPIVDYHVMRLMLRLGCVTLPGSWVEENTERRIVGKEREFAIRNACYRAMKLLARLSGIAGDVLDGLIWSGRRYCAEEKIPDCHACVFTDACEHRVRMFQPVYVPTIHY